MKFATVLALGLASLALSAEAWGGEEEAVLLRARQLVEQKAYADAIGAYGSISRWLERDPGLLIEWARVYAYADRQDDAIVLLERVAAEHPERAGEVEKDLAEQRIYRDLNRARKHVEKREYARALVLYEKLGPWLERDPGLLIEWARVYSYTDRNPEALALFERVVAAHPEKAESLAREIAEQRTFAELQRARTLVEREKYAEALAVYDRLGELLRTDPGLLIERARVYSYANMHEEAIRMFEEVRTRHPEQVPVFIIELGDMYAWDGQIDTAIATYRQAVEANPYDEKSRIALARALTWNGLHREAIREFDEVLKAHPDSVSAMVGKADALAWLDRLEDAWDLLDRAREVDPANLDAMNGQARILVWNGLHRKGAAEYDRILERFPGNLDAMEGQAFARHWDGRDGEASTILRELLRIRPTRTEAGKLMHELRDVARPYLRLDGDYADDSNDRQVLETGFYAGKLLMYGLRLEGFYEWLFVEEPDSDAAEGATREYRLDRAGLGLEWRMAEAFNFRTRVGRLYSSQTDWEDVTGDGRLEWMPDDRWLLGLSYERDFLRDGDAIEQELLTRGWGLGARYRLDRRWAASVRGKDTEYTDGNEQQLAFAALEYRFRAVPYMKTYYNYNWSRWDREVPDYFSLERFRSHALGVFGSWKASKWWSAEGQGTLGYEIHESGGSGLEAGPTARLWSWFGAAGLRWRPSPTWSVGVRVERFESHAIDGPAEDEYSRTRYVASLACALGGRFEEAEPVQAGTPPPEGRGR